MAAGLLAACASTAEPGSAFDGEWLVDGSLRTAPQAEAAARAGAPARVALVLGGGGLRGYAHIGVLQALEEAGVRADLVVGTSIGAIIGAAYAAGSAPDQLWRQASTLQMGALADVALRGPGFMRGEALGRWAGRLVGGQAIERFPRRFAAVATDIETGLPFVITRGDAGQALRASAAIPGVFVPVQSSGTRLVDGGVAALVPVAAARALGAEVVIAVDIYCNGPKYPSTSAMSLWLRVSQMQSCLLSRPEESLADVLIAPAVSAARLGDAESRERARRLGYESAIAALPAIHAALDRRARTAPADPVR